MPRFVADNQAVIPWEYRPDASPREPPRLKALPYELLLVWNWKRGPDQLSAKYYRDFGHNQQLTRQDTDLDRAIRY